MDLGELKVRISADIAKLSQGLQQAQAKMQSAGAKMQSIGGGMQSVGKSMSLAVTAPILLMGKLGYDELKSIQEANAQTAASIKRVGAGALVSVKGIQAQASALQKLSGMDDQAIQSGQNLLLTQGNLNIKTKQGAAAFERASRVMVDYAAATGKDPVAAAKGLAKALADPENALSRVAKEAGITKNQQAALKKQMAAVTDPAAKQAILLGALEGKYKGAGAAAGETLGAKMAILQDRLAGVSAAFIEKLIPAVDQMVGWAGQLMGWVEKLSPAQQKWAAIMAVVAAAMGPVLIIVGSLVSAIGALLPVVAALLGPVGLVIAACVLFALALVTLWKKNEAFRDGVLAAWEAVKQGVASVLDSLKSSINVWVGWAKAFWAAYGENIKTVASAAWGFIKDYIGGVLTVIKGVVQTALALLRGDWQGAWDGIKTILAGAWEAIKALIGAQLTIVKTVLSTAWSVIKGAASIAWDAVKDAIGAVWDQLKTDIGAKIAAVKSALGTAWNAIDAAAGKAWSNIKTGIVEIIDGLPNALVRALSDLAGKMGDMGGKAGTAFASAVKGAINAVIGKFNDFEIPAVSVLGKEVSPAISLPNLPTFARGGIASGPSIFGEAGLEAAVPLGDSATARRDRARVMRESGLGGSGLTQEFNFYGAQVNPFAIAEQAKFAMMGAGLAQ